jgi:hypothetical protein
MRSRPLELPRCAAPPVPCYLAAQVATPLDSSVRLMRLCRISGGDDRSLSRGRWRSRVKPARPYICRLIILVFVFTPSVLPLWCGVVSAAVTAWRSRSGRE